MNNLLSSIRIYRVKRAFTYAFLSVVITVILLLLGSNYQIAEIKNIKPTLFFGFVFGLLLGILDDIILHSRISKWSYKYRTILKLLAIPIIVIILLASIAVFFDYEDLQIGEGKVLSHFISLFKNASILTILLVTFLVTIANEIHLILGDNFFMDYILGNFRGPTKEDRIFMFLDLKDSTSIAEKIGDIKFYELLNDCYTLLGTVATHRKAEILKYVGDEAILSWSSKPEGNAQKCISLFYDFKSLLQEQENFFTEKYGFKPLFTAAAHHGPVISAYLGSVKKQKDYSGDVMNTTARIEGLTDKYNAELLISENLYIKIEPIEAERIEGVTLKGKALPITIYKVL